MGGPDPSNDAQLVQTVEALVLQLSDGRLDVFSSHLGTHANAVVAGSYPAALGRNVIDHHADHAAWRATDEEIRKLTAAAWPRADTKTGVVLAPGQAGLSRSLRIPPAIFPSTIRRRAGPHARAAPSRRRWKLFVGR